MTLRAQGVEQPFATTDRRAFALAAEGAEAPKVEDRYTLQGPRPLLARFTDARPDQSVTILAEHHPGGSDLFVLAIDLCPPNRSAGSSAESSAGRALPHGGRSATQADPMPRRRPPAVGLLLGLLAATMVACRPTARRATTATPVSSARSSGA